VADFGLSKIIEASNEDEMGTSLELTSKGAGTLWYLPPECFRAENARISNRVDVFSCGVIFYQMLYGRKPFGEGTKQEEFAHKAGSGMGGWEALSFPPDTKERKVSPEAREFLKKALALHVDERPDVAAICTESYLRRAFR